MAAVRTLRRAVIAITNRDAIEAFIAMDPSPVHKVLETMHARDGEQTVDFHRRVNSYMDMEAANRKVLAIHIFVPKNL